VLGVFLATRSNQRRQCRVSVVSGLLFIAPLLDVSRRYPPESAKSARSAIMLLLFSPGAEKPLQDCYKSNGLWKEELCQHTEPVSGVSGLPFGPVPGGVRAEVGFASFAYQQFSSRERRQKIGTTRQRSHSPIAHNPPPSAIMVFFGSGATARRSGLHQ
jgi:hypothetical protein